MRLFTSLIAGVAAFMVTTTASAALFVTATPSATSFLPGETVTIDIQISTTAPEALALGLRAANYDPTILTNAVATIVPASIFNFSPTVPFGGLGNNASGLEQAPAPGVRAGFSVNLFQGVSTTPAAGAGPENFQVQFTAGAPGTTTVDVGAFADYSDVYLGGDGGQTPDSVTITVVPEPGTALLMGLGLAGLAAAGRKE